MRLSSGRIRASLCANSVIPGRRGDRRKPTLCCRTRSALRTCERCKKRSFPNGVANGSKTQRGDWASRFLGAQHLLDSDRPKKRKWRDVQSTIAPVSVALRSSRQPYAYNHKEPKESGDHAGCDANRRPGGQDLFRENQQRQCGDPEQNRIRNDIGERQFCRHARLSGSPDRGRPRSGERRRRADCQMRG